MLTTMRHEKVINFDECEIELVYIKSEIESRESEYFVDYDILDYL